MSPSTAPVIPDVSARKLYEYRVAGKAPEEVPGSYGRAMRILMDLGVPRDVKSYPEFVEAVRNALPENVRSAFKIAYSLVSSIGKVTPDSLYSVARRLKRVGIRKVTLGFLLGLLKGIKVPGPARIPSGLYEEDPVTVTLAELGGIAKIRDVKKRLEMKGYENIDELIRESFKKGKFYPIPEGKRSPTISYPRQIALESAVKYGSVESEDEEYITYRIPKDAVSDLKKEFAKAMKELSSLVMEEEDSYIVKVPVKDNIRIIIYKLL